MRTIGIKYTLLLFCMSFLLLWPSQMFSQKSKLYLEKKKERLEKSIEYADLLINAAHEQKSSTLGDISLLKSKIDSRKALIDNYHQSQNLLFDTIFINLLRIDKISTQLQELKDEYALMVNSAYKNHNLYKRLVYVLASEDINQAYSRFNYYKYYAKKRNAQIENIRNVESVYFERVEQLEVKAQQNQQIIDEIDLENQKLENEVLQMTELLAELNHKVDELIYEQKQDRRSALNLEKKIEEVINDEVLNAGDLASTEQLIITPTPETAGLSDGFANNYGKLPWPLERGIISVNFGEQDYPELEGVIIKNNGINILTQEGAIARSVFEGTVTRVLSVPNYNNVVILRHGDYLTVYSNLAEVFVEKGMVVKLKQDIGAVFTNDDESKTELHFEIWNGKQLQDPENWITSLHLNETHLNQKP